MKIAANEFDDDLVPFEDETLRVTPIPISPSPLPPPRTPPITAFRDLFVSFKPTPQGTGAELQAYRKSVVNEMFHLTHFYDADANDDPPEEEIHMSPEDRKRREELMHQNLPATSPSPVTMAYLIKNHDIPGKFDLAKALALGIPQGKLFSTLKNGENVRVTRVVDGDEIVRTIQPEEVLLDPIPGAVVLIVDIPSVEYIANVVENAGLNREEVKKADIVVHMLSDEVVRDERYVKWMDSFKDSSKVCSLIDRFLTIAPRHGAEFNARQYNPPGAIRSGYNPKRDGREYFPITAVSWGIQRSWIREKIHSGTGITFSILERTIYH